jgi:inner membrane protein
VRGGKTVPRRAATLVLTAAASFPDIDVLAQRLGASRGSPWLHRGALHSLAMAALVGIAVSLLAGGLGRSRPRMAVTAALVAASHGLLDALTVGGSGVMFFWPLRLERLLAPWHLLPAAPIGLRIVSARGLDVLLLEALTFSPLVVYALWPRVPAPAKPTLQG